MSRHLLYIVLAVALLAACCPCREVSTSTSAESVTRRDSVYIAHYDTVRIVERDTMRLAQLEQWHERVMARGESFLENAYCTSRASMGEDGWLTHTLDTKREAMLPVREVESERVIRDTVYIERESANATSNTQATTVIKRVKKPLSLFVKTQIIALWVIVACIVIKHRKVIIRVFSGWRI